MDKPIGRWLVSDFAVLDIHLQPWMLVTAAIFLLAFFVIWITGSFDRSD